MKRFILLVFVAAGFFLTFFCETPAQAENNSIEQSFTSSTDYDNAVQQIKVKVEFTAPSGNKRTLPGFWDGGRAWRVRFSPDEQGGWTYKTACSDQSNKGLHNQTGHGKSYNYNNIHYLSFPRKRESTKSITFLDPCFRRDDNADRSV
jgi:hypothetical protein